MPSRKKIEISFEASPENSVIWCHRVVSGTPQSKYVSYARGEKPMLELLTQREQASWHDAILLMGW